METWYTTKKKESLNSEATELNSENIGRISIILWGKNKQFKL